MSDSKIPASKATGMGHKAAAEASDLAEDVATSPWLARLARLGLAARATIYVVMALLALQLAFGDSHKEVDQNGALRTVARQSYGSVLLWLLALGFLSYALWRATEAAYGEVGGDSKPKTRISCGVRALVYLALALTSIAVVTGTGNAKGGSAGQDRAFSASLMKSTGGRVLVGVLGLIVAVVGATMIVDGWKKNFERYLRMDQMTPTVRKVVSGLGRVGTIARGLVFLIVGLLTLRAAWQHQPNDSGGIDEAIKSLAHTPGSWLLIVVAVGLLAFGVYGFAEARWRRTGRSAT